MITLHTSAPVALDTSAVAQIINEAAASHANATAAEKAQLIQACTSLISSLEAPELKLMGLVFSGMKAVTIRLGIDMGLFDLGARALKLGQNVTLEQMSKETKCEALLIRRVMRILIDMDAFKEVDQNVFQPQPSVKIYQSESPIAQANIHFTRKLGLVAKLPDYFAEKGYQCPADAFDGTFQYAMGTKLDIFDWIAAHPREQHAFNVTMTWRAKLMEDAKWFHKYPIERVLSNGTAEDVFVVDVGAGVGHLLIDLKKHHPEIPGKLIVQDIAPVIQCIESLPDGVEAMAHNFFDPQPVKNAKAYFLAHIIHDWPDKQAKIILGHIRDAMGPDSVMLLHETPMPERDVPFVPSIIDMSMMAGFSSLERTESQFRTLLDEVGLELVGNWKAKQTSSSLSLGQSVLEIKLKSQTNGAQSNGHSNGVHSNGANGHSNGANGS